MTITSEQTCKTPSAYVLVGEFPWRGSNLHIVGVWLDLNSALAAMTEIEVENEAWNEWITSKSEAPKPPCRHLINPSLVICPLK